VRVARGTKLSRRKAQVAIKSGRVRVNGVRVSSPATRVSDGDEVSVDDAPMDEASLRRHVYDPKKIRLWAYHKKRGENCTDSDPDGQPTIYESMSASDPDYHTLPRLINVGRLDFHSEGLLLMTNNGYVSRWLELPSSGVERVYEVRCKHVLSSETVAAMEAGVCINAFQYQPFEIERVDRRADDDHDAGPDQQHLNWYRVLVREGKVLVVCVCVLVLVCCPMMR
jgi:23S rRNA pseudouridine2605 synthase